VAQLVGGADSPWERVPVDVPPAAFGPGSRSPFSHYFEGESCVTVRSVDDIVAWLRTCEYASDLEQFHDPDLWQDPSAFEQRRRGDCEDFALWTWRKLVEMGVDAEFFVGRVGDPGSARQHAWVVYHDGHKACLFEPAAADREQMIRPWSEVKDRYVPHFAVDRRFATSAFAGWLRSDVVLTERQVEPPGDFELAWRGGGNDARHAVVAQAGGAAEHERVA
jgi:hypothetical protein